MEILKLKIPNMKCAGCSKAVDNHLRKIGGISSFSIDVQSQIVEIQYGGNKTIKSLILRTLDGIGFAGVEVD
jgi:copper chaperone CopZ